MARSNIGRHLNLGLLVSLCSILTSVINAQTIATNATAQNATSDGAACSCGFYDASNGNLFTDFMIVYFNETASFPVEGFVASSYLNPYEKAWNAIYRQSADPSNVRIAPVSNYQGENSSRSLNSSLELSISNTTADHIVIGGGIETIRKDIKFGSFRTLMHSPRPGAGGSALSMMLQYNETESMSVDMYNTKNQSLAWISQLVHGEFPDRDLGVNYSDLINSTFTPWDFTEMRIDWTEKEVNYYVEGNLTRSVRETTDAPIMSVPGPLYLKHWSTGNFYSMQGPPKQRSIANVGWVRMFFNSSLTSDDDAKNFDSRCQVTDACSMDDFTLRGSSPYSSDATLLWKQKHNSRSHAFAAVVISIACISITSLLLLNSFLKWLARKRIFVRKQVSRRNWPFSAAPGAAATTSQSGLTTLRNSLFETALATMTPGRVQTPLNVTRPSSFKDSGTVTPMNAWTRPPSVRSQWDGDFATQVPRTGVVSVNPSESDFAYPIPRTGIISVSPSIISDRPEDVEKFAQEDRLSSEDDAIKPILGGTITPRNAYLPEILEYEPFKPISTTSSETRAEHGSEKVVMSEKVSEAGSEEISEKSGKDADAKGFSVTERPVNEKEIKDVDAAAAIRHDKAVGMLEPKTGVKDIHAPTGPVKRVDYLAGLVGMCSILVTANHFCLTYAAASIDPAGFPHYSSEHWARLTVGAYLLNGIWIGPFLMTSTRFLVGSFLRNGKLGPIAQKVVGRPFRLLVPTYGIVLLEYFFINVGAIKWLEYLPSITWSQYPFTVGYNSFGNFLSEVLELAFLIPNAVPQVTFNFCTGVLWTIPVQLQGSWITLIGVIMVRECKTPWKRFAFYWVCIIQNWYFLNWGQYFYCGIMLADLDITYKWREWLYKRWWAYWPLVTLMCALPLASLSIDLVTQWTNVNYSTYEHGWHPDPNTGLPIGQTANAGYPEYYVPKLNGAVFAVSLQCLVELSPRVQWFFSTKPFQLIFPHIFTIYLFHGFIFWSLGAWLCIKLSTLGVAYWLNILLVALCCYVTLFLSLSILTPVVEALGKTLTGNIWHAASEAPAERKPTLYPFRENLFLSRYETSHEDKTKDATLDNMKNNVKEV